MVIALGAQIALHVPQPEHRRLSVIDFIFMAICAISYYSLLIIIQIEYLTTNMVEHFDLICSAKIRFFSDLVKKWEGI